MKLSQKDGKSVKTESQSVLKRKKSFRLPDFPTLRTIIFGLIQEIPLGNNTSILFYRSNM